MKMPKRSIQHVSETASFKIFSKQIPNHWIIREVTERDYGIDCYVELVDKNDNLTGHLLLFQLKSQAKVNWSKKDPDHYNFPAIDIGTVNYWFHFAVPVFVCLIDLAEERTFFLPVKTFVRSNYAKYAAQEDLSFRFSKVLELGSDEGVSKLLYLYFRDLRLLEFENTVITFITHFPQYKEFVIENFCRDCFLGVEGNRILYLKHMYNNLAFLSQYMGMPWEIDPIADYERRSQERFGNDYRLYEQQMSEIVTLLDKKLLPLFLALKKIICEDEIGYWFGTESELFHYVLNTEDSGPPLADL